ncbi:MAG: DNA-directed RNA polymerase subunit omega [Gemmatimonadota bacterium]|nr:MAG: DNA-directed RNA polymerase subunit omega [Gemmatimonadota bacterium]
MTLVSLEEIKKSVPNVYEAVMIAAREARRINAERLAEKAQFIEEEEPVQEQNLLGEHEQTEVKEVEEKVTVAALKRLAEGKVGFSFTSDED